MLIIISEMTLSTSAACVHTRAWRNLEYLLKLDLSYVDAVHRVCTVHVSANLGDVWFIRN